MGVLSGCRGDDGGFTPQVDGAAGQHDSGVHQGDGAPAQHDQGGTQPGKDQGTNPPPNKDQGTNPPPNKDQGTPPKQDGGTPPPPPPGAIKVAAVQYGPASYSYVPGCSSIMCGLKHFVTQAAKNGATHIVTPEGVSGQGKYAELDPKVGEKPAASAKWGPTTVMSNFAKLADSLNVTVIFNVITQVGSGASAKLYNTDVAVGPNGTVVQVHHKYYLYGEKGITAGTNCCDMFQTPAGKAGILICADINCTIYAVHNQSKSSCTKSGLALMNAYVAAKPRITFISMMWLATGSSNKNWKPLNVQADFAKYSKSYVVSANWIGGTNDKYRGGGVFKPDGTALGVWDKKQPGIAYGVIPKPGSPPPPPPPASGVVITEFMANPAAVSDTNGEWLELYNASKNTINLAGWRLADNGGKTHTIKSLSIAPGQYAVLGRNTSTAQNGGVPVAYSYGSWALTNTGDEIILYNSANKIVDKVAYTSSWGVKSGASLSLKAIGADNSIGSNWCVETTTWPGSAGDKGTPGKPAICK